MKKLILFVFEKNQFFKTLFQVVVLVLALRSYGQSNVPLPEQVAENLNRLGWSVDSANYWGPDYSQLRIQLKDGTEIQYAKNRNGQFELAALRAPLYPYHYKFIVTMEPVHPIHEINSRALFSENRFNAVDYARRSEEKAAQDLAEGRRNDGQYFLQPVDTWTWARNSIEIQQGLNGQSILSIAIAERKEQNRYEEQIDRLIQVTLPRGQRILYAQYFTISSSGSAEQAQDGLRLAVLFDNGRAEMVEYALIGIDPEKSHLRGLKRIGQARPLDLKLFKFLGIGSVSSACLNLF